MRMMTEECLEEGRLSVVGREFFAPFHEPLPKWKRTEAKVKKAVLPKKPTPLALTPCCAEGATIISWINEAEGPHGRVEMLKVLQLHIHFKHDGGV